VRGPVQVLVLGFEHPVFNGELVAELSRLRAAGVVRLVDLLLVERVDEDTFETLAPPEGMPEDLGRLTARLLGRSAGADPVEQDAGTGWAAPAWSLTDSIPVGATAAVALIEHLWAAPLREVVRRAGGAALDETWLAERDVLLLDALATSTEP
jgi:hypothetical protein